MLEPVLSTRPSDSSIILTKLSSRSLFNIIVQTFLRPLRPNLVKPGRPLPAGSPKLRPHSSIDKGCPATKIQIDNIYLYNIIAKPKSASSAKGAPPSKVSELPQHRLLYFAGGGFQSPPAKEHWKLLAEPATQLSDLHTVTLVSYPLAPRSPAADSLPQLHILLQRFLDETTASGGSVTLVGDSAGGNVALSLALHYATQLNEGEPGGHYHSLKNVLVISPPTDLRNANPDVAVADRRDSVLCTALIESVARAWAGDWPRDRPQLSPILGDIGALWTAGLRVHGVVGTYDVLAPDAVAFRKRCQEKGAKGEWLEWKGQMHCFPLAFAYGLPEGKRGKAWVVDMLKRYA